MDKGAKGKHRTGETRAGRTGQAERSRISPSKTGLPAEGESESVPHNFPSAPFTRMKSSGYFKTMRCIMQISFLLKGAVVSIFKDVNAWKIIGGEMRDFSPPQNFLGFSKLSHLHPASW